MPANFSYLIRARFAREVLALCAQGYNEFDICEKLSDWFDNQPWRTYCAVVPIYNSEKAKKAYAKAYLIRALSENGFNNVQISKIAGYTPQRCGQILKKAV